MQLDHKLLKIELNGIEFAYSEYGVEYSPVVLFAHGAGQTRHAWKNAAKELALNGFHTVAMDLRGHGDSSWSAEQAYSIRDFAQDLVAAAEHFGSEGGAPHLVGASLGGLSALVSAGVLKPGIFASITLVDITPSMDFGGVDKVLGFMSANSADGFESLEEVSQLISMYLPHRERPKDLNGLRKNLRKKANDRWYWHWDPAFLNAIDRSASDERIEEFESAVRLIDVPIHLIRGKMSELVSEASVEHFRILAPHAHYTNVAGASHMVAGDDNDAFNKAVADFLMPYQQVSA
jgi:pimeloyl-ACP methyl ester carboxylesterase